MLVNLRLPAVYRIVPVIRSANNADTTPPVKLTARAVTHFFRRSKISLVDLGLPSKQSVSLRMSQAVVCYFKSAAAVLYATDGPG